MNVSYPVPAAIPAEAADALNTPVEQPCSATVVGVGCDVVVNSVVEVGDDVVGVVVVVVDGPLPQPRRATPAPIRTRTFTTEEDSDLLARIRIVTSNSYQLRRANRRAPVAVSPQQPYPIRRSSPPARGGTPPPAH
jgi:hypothetical protein